ncbi:MAG: tRNA-dependent cyclodipeptide synthase, partial [Holosporales bacterium]|nr:tRNA-dependent cyclodipeptide synthase [Holosporales bacterium]
MELKSQFKYSTIPATPESERIFSQKEHALIGISPFNGYYTEANLEKIFYWALNTFKNISVFIPTEISAYTLQAMEYEKEKAQKKTFRQDCLLKNKALRALEANKLSKTEAENKIVRLSDINAGEKYTKFYDKYVDLYDNDKDFRAGSLLTSKWVLETKGIFCDVEDEAVRAAVKYFLAELPLYLNTPEILNVSSSLFVYKDLPSPFLQNIYNDNLLVSPGQGYLTVKIECPTNNDAEDSMRKNSIYIKNILNQVSGSIYWKNRDGTYLGCNQKEAELVGLSSPEDLIGKT